MMEKIRNMLGGRKMMFAMILLALSTAMVFIGKADFNGWSEFIKWVLGIYVVGNVGEYATNKKEQPTKVINKCICYGKEDIKK